MIEIKDSFARFIVNVYFYFSRYIDVYFHETACSKPMPGSTTQLTLSFACVHLTHVHLTQVHLTHVHLTHVQLTHIHITHVHLTHVHLTHVHLTHVHITHVHITHVHLTHVQHVDELSYLTLQQRLHCDEIDAKLCRPMGSPVPVFSPHQS